MVLLLSAAWLVQADPLKAATTDEVAAVQQRLANEVKLTQERGGIKSGALESLERVQRGGKTSIDGLAGLEMAALTLEQKRFAYQVRTGDSLYSIGTRRETSVEELQELNNLRTTEIYPEQRLILPARSISQSTFRGEEDGQAAPESLPESGEPAVEGRLADWWTDASKVFGVYSKALVTDVETGMSFQVQRRGGSKHADSQPLTRQDTQTMLEIYGGEWSWARRAVVVTVNGQHLAASMNGMPHGDGAIKNNGFPGHFCIHFLNSRTHETDSLDPQHQAMVSKAAGL